MRLKWKWEITKHHLHGREQLGFTYDARLARPNFFVRRWIRARQRDGASMYPVGSGPTERQAVMRALRQMNRSRDRSYTTTYL